MGLFGTSNTTLMNQMNQHQQGQFKAINNLLTLQENHVEDFFQYHGETFLAALAQLMEDVTQKVLGQMLPKMKFVTNTNGDMEVSSDALAEYATITAENIQLDLQNLLASAINSEVIMQRRMAKQQYLEAQGFQAPAAQAPQVANAGGLDPSQIQGSNAAVGMNNQMNTQMMAMNNQSGYPIPPSGYDNMNNPYWIDPMTGQPTYTPPSSGLGLGQAISKGVAWAKWLA
tara:strand:- start:219 stop:905 length:687 start_codon:yes stop_codon:yes gene_type:complete